MRFSLLLTAIGLFAVLIRYDYMYFTTLSRYRSVHVAMCNRVIRPDPNYVLPNESTWQVIRHSSYGTVKELFLYNAYLDKRNLNEYMV